MRYTVDRRPPHRIDPNSKLLIIEWPSNGHDGGDLAFGNDGYLYVSSGDGSSGSDANLTGQRIDDLLAAVLRIDVDHPDPGRNYGVPKDNPFVDRPGARPELWAYGLRNPWRLSYDRESGQLWVGKNGQDLWEQVYLIQKGGNYGWSLSEGSHVFHATRQAGPDPISPPAAEHPHSEARSLTGGRVYRGTRLPELVGAYVYGDWSTGRVWGIKHDGTKADLAPRAGRHALQHHRLRHRPRRRAVRHRPASGGFYRLEPTTEADRPSQPFPTRLSQTGLFASVADHKPHPAAIPFEVNAPQWADGATMERFAALPGLERIEQKPQLNAGGAWTLPNGSVLVQTLCLDRFDDSGKPARKRIETRLLVRQQGEWTGYSYRWNAEQTDAELVPRRRHRRGRSRCPTRPRRAAVASRPGGSPPEPSAWSATRERPASSLGFTPAPARPRPRLRRHHRQPAPRARAHRRVPGRAAHAGATTGPDWSIPTRRGLRWRPGSSRTCTSTARPATSTRAAATPRMELGLNTPLGEMRLIDEVPSHDRFDITDARLVAPGSPERSVLYQRISRRGTGQMPPLVLHRGRPRRP